MVWMEKNGIPVTRINYVKHAGIDGDPDDLDPEIEASLPPELQEGWVVD